jgi:hypothetical protein
VQIPAGDLIEGRVVYSLRTIGDFRLTDILASVLGLIGYVAVAGFISYWAHRAQAEEGRAANAASLLSRAPTEKNKSGSLSAQLANARQS